MKALEIRHSIPKYLLSRTVYSINRRAWKVGYAPISLVDADLPHPPDSGWARLRVRLAGICGSDLSVLTGGESLYMEPEASYPFIPGHELVGTVDQVMHGLSTPSAGIQPGDRVGVWPVLGCRARDRDPCIACSSGWDGLCSRRSDGWPDHGIAIGFNHDTGGGWSDACLAHHSQLWKLPPSVTDEDAVLLDAAATSLAGVLRTGSEVNERTLIVGGGTIGLLTAYLHSRLQQAGTCEIIVRHSFQQDWAEEHGLSATILGSEPAFMDWASERGIASRKITGYGTAFTGVYDRVIVAAGSRSSFDWGMRTVRPGGTLALLTSPALLKRFDPTPLWFREINLQGHFVYGPVRWQGDVVHPYELLIDGLEKGTLSFRSLLTHTFPLSRYREAIDTALSRSGTGAIKVAMQPDSSTEHITAAA